jgi:hypothetical protein
MGKQSAEISMSANVSQLLVILLQGARTRNLAICVLPAHMDTQEVHSGYVGWRMLGPKDSNALTLMSVPATTAVAVTLHVSTQLEVMSVASVILGILVKDRLTISVSWSMSVHWAGTTALAILNASLQVTSHLYVFVRRLDTSLRMGCASRTLILMATRMKRLLDAQKSGV